MRIAPHFVGVVACEWLFLDGFDAVVRYLELDETVVGIWYLVVVPVFGDCFY